MPTCSPALTMNGSAFFRSSVGGMATTSWVGKRCWPSSRTCSSEIRSSGVSSEFVKGALPICDEFETLSSSLPHMATTSHRHIRRSAGYRWSTEARMISERQGSELSTLQILMSVHLGIFVSAAVARFEHRAILESIGEIEALSPGLYEMKIENPTGDPDCRKPHYSVRFEARRVEDLHFPGDSAALKRVSEISDLTETVYKTFLSPMGAGSIQSLDC